MEQDRRVLSSTEEDEEMGDRFSSSDPDEQANSDIAIKRGHRQGGQPEHGYSDSDQGNEADSEREEGRQRGSWSSAKGNHNGEDRANLTIHEEGDEDIEGRESSEEIDIGSPFRSSDSRGTARSPRSISESPSERSVGSSGKPERPKVKGEEEEKKPVNRVLTGAVRKGKWTTEEEVYTLRIIQDFGKGYLPLPAGTTLRSYLSEKLNCDPMRITKKFAGAACIGKRIFMPNPDKALCAASAKELAEMETRFLEKLNQNGVVILPSTSLPPPKYLQSVPIPAPQSQPPAPPRDWRPPSIGNRCRSYPNLSSLGRERSGGSNTGGGGMGGWPHAYGQFEAMDIDISAGPTGQHRSHVMGYPGGPASFSPASRYAADNMLVGDHRGGAMGSIPGYQPRGKRMDSGTPSLSDNDAGSLLLDFFKSVRVEHAEEQLEAERGRGHSHVHPMLASKAGFRSTSTPTLSALAHACGVGSSLSSSSSTDLLGLSVPLPFTQHYGASRSPQASYQRPLKKQKSVENFSVLMKDGNTY